MAKVVTEPNLNDRKIKEMKICSYNCCSLRKNIEMVRKVIDSEYDIILLQETFITEEKLGDIDSIDENYESVGVGAKYSEKNLVSGTGRPEGALVCLWKSNAWFDVDKIVLEDNICVICISIGVIKILVVNVYLNSDIWETSTLARYLESLSRLETILADFRFECIYFMGDFNADPYTGRAWQNL